MEFKTRKEIIYRNHRDTVCTYEMDDTPPFELNGDALDIALSIGSCTAAPWSTRSISHGSSTWMAASLPVSSVRRSSA